MKSPTETGLVPADNSLAVSAIIERSGGNARFAYEEFFKATITISTRRAYARIVGRLLDWCERHDLQFRQITPGLAGDHGEVRNALDDAQSFLPTV